MSNLVGEPFDEYVAKQVLDRQLIHGSPTRDNSTLTYLNGNTSWIRVVSGVLVKDLKRLQALGINDSQYLNSGLAKNFILFNGTSDVNNTLFGGIDKTQSLLNKVAYGIGGTEFGLRPMPGVTSCETKFRNRGSIREGTISLKAFNRTQFEIISLLYLRLGFPILLEWGHSIIIGKDGKVDTNPNFSISSDFLDGKFKNDNEVLQALENKRKESCGNFDAMYGRVVNFDWTFEKDGSYNITLKLMSIGAVVEGLKMNVYTKDQPSVSNEEDANDEQPENDKDWIVKYKFSHSIGYTLFLALRKLTSISDDLGIKSISVSEVIKSLAEDITTSDVVLAELGLNQERKFDSKDFIYSSELDTYYIRMGTFLSLLKQLIPSNLTDKDNPSPLLNLDTSNQNYIYTENLQISSDPRICLVGGFKIKLPNSEDFIIPQRAPNPFKINLNGVQVGLVNNIYLNTTLILQKLNDLKDDNGGVSFYDLIQSILESITKALGNINQLSFVVDENKNLAKIIDDTPIPGIEKAFPNTFSKESPTFNVFGYYNNGTSAGFIRDFSLKTEITNNLLSTLTIGATANGTVVGEDATAFSKWNQGLEPIINKGIDYPDSKSSKEDSIPVKTKQLISENSQLTNAYYLYEAKQTVREGNNVFEGLEVDNLDGNVDLVSNFLAYKKNLDLLSTQFSRGKKIASATSSRGFLPINLSLTMDGLAGIKIYQQIKVDTAFLPMDYPTSLKFIIKGVTNKVDKNGWITSVETVSVPVIDTLEEVTPNTIPTNNTKITPPKQSEERAESRNNVNAERLRSTLTRLGYQEKGTEIDNSGEDISANIEKAASSLFNTIKQELPNLQIRVTGGNDKYHKGLGYESRHSKANAIDFTIAPKTEDNLDKVVKILQRYAAGNAPNFRFIDEYRNLSSAGSGNHFHISFGAGTEGQTTLNNALKLVQEGKITPIKIT